MTPQERQFISQLYQEEYQQLLHTAVRMIGDFSAAEDLVDETFFILLTQLDHVQQHPNPIAWLHKVLKNAALDELRKRQRHASVSLEDAPGLSYEDDFISFYDSLPNTLSEIEKEVLILSCQYRLNCVEIADMLHISREASRARLSRARRHYAKWLMDWKLQ